MKVNKISIKAITLPCVTITLLLCPLFAGANNLTTGTYQCPLATSVGIYKTSVGMRSTGASIALTLSQKSGSGSATFANVTVGKNSVVCTYRMTGGSLKYSNPYLVPAAGCTFNGYKLSALQSTTTATSVGSAITCP